MVTPRRHGHAGKTRTVIVAAAITAMILSGVAAGPTAYADSAQSDAPTPADLDELGTAGLPFGPTKIPFDMFGGLFTGTKMKVYPKHALSDLGTAQASGMRIFLVLVGSQSNYRNPDGTFNLDMWKASLDNFRGIDLSEFINDGTIISHQLIDEPKARTQWGGVVIPNDVLDEMARYSKEIWPMMSTVVRVEPAKLMKHAGGWETPWPDFEWKYLDAAWAQYSARKGPVAEQAAEQQAEADRQKLALVVGLNVLDGGNGSSGDPSPNDTGEWTMSPDEVRNYGLTLMSQTNSCGFMMWRYETPGSDLEDYVYFRRPDINAVMQDLAQVAAQTPASPCRFTFDGSFIDDDGHVFEASIEWLAAEGITKGCNPPANNMFCPNDNVTRGQMAAFLVRVLGLTDRLEDPFTDDDNSVFEADIEKLAAGGITRGCNPPINDRFCPTHAVTRGQMAALLVRALGYTDDGSGDLFIDDNSSVFEDDIDKLGTAGVTRGCNPPTNNKYCPDRVVTRGQMAAFLHRALG